MTKRVKPWHGQDTDAFYEAVAAAEYADLMARAATFSGLSWEVAGTLSGGEVTIDRATDPDPAADELAALGWPIEQRDEQARPPKPAKRKRGRKGGR